MLDLSRSARNCFDSSEALALDSSLDRNQKRLDEQRHLQAMVIKRSEVLISPSWVAITKEIRKGSVSEPGAATFKTPTLAMSEVDGEYNASFFRNSSGPGGLQGGGDSLLSCLLVDFIEQRFRRFEIGNKQSLLNSSLYIIHSTFQTGF